MNNNKPPSEATSSEEKMTYAIYDLKTAMEFIAVQAQRAAQRDAENLALRKENEEQGETLKSIQALCFLYDPDEDGSKSMVDQLYIMNGIINHIIDEIKSYDHLAPIRKENNL